MSELSGWVYDVEVYADFYMVGFLRIDGDEHRVFASYLQNMDDLKPWWDAHQSDLMIGFNNHAYDDMILKMFLDGVRCHQTILGASSNYFANPPRWAARPFKSRTIDLLAIGGRFMGSLKWNGVLLDHKRLQELPYPAGQALVAAEKCENVIAYNYNDLQITKKVAFCMQEGIKARFGLNQAYGVDVSSDKDASVGSTILSKLMFNCQRSRELTRHRSRKRTR